jgi:hypothetical protein
VGFAFKSGKLSLRAAWQRWTQPASTSTLAPVATAGIPLDDRLVSSGGQATRRRVEVHGELDQATQLSGFYDDEKVRNWELGVRIPVPQIQFVELLRNTSSTSLRGLVGRHKFRLGAQAAGLSVNRMLTKFSSRQICRSRDSPIYFKDIAGNIVNSSTMRPLMPRELFVLGNLDLPQRIYFSAQAVTVRAATPMREHRGTARADLDRCGRGILGDARQALHRRRRCAGPLEQSEEDKLPGRCSVSLLKRPRAGLLACSMPRPGPCSAPLSRAP